MKEYCDYTWFSTRGDGTIIVHICILETGHEERHKDINDREVKTLLSTSKKEIKTKTQT